MATTADTAGDAPAGPGRWDRARGWAPTLVLGVVLPLLTYSMLRGRLGEAGALAIGAVWPLLLAVGSAVIRRRVDELAVASLVLQLLGVVVAVASAAPRLLLVKNGAETGVVGVVLLGSLLTARPVVFWLGRRFATDGSAESGRRWDRLWRYPPFRRACRVMTVVWGVGLLVEAAARVVIALWAPVWVGVVVGHVLPTTVIVGLIALTGVYGARVRRANVPVGVPDPITGEATPPPTD